jgi:hypothetical protein
MRQHLGTQGAKVLAPSTTLADLLTPLPVANPFSAVRASLRPGDEFDDGLTP